MGHHHDHDHHHSHHCHSHGLSGTKLLWVTLLNAVVTVAQLVAGVLTGSLALLSDALHNFSDVIALLVTYIANRVAARDSTETSTFGYKRAEILAALFNAAVLVGLSVTLIVESVERWFHPQPVDPMAMMVMALLSVAVNGGSVWMLKHERHHNLNLRSAYLHLFSDMLTSAAVLLGGVVLDFHPWYCVDSALCTGISI